MNIILDERLWPPHGPTEAHGMAKVYQIHMPQHVWDQLATEPLPEVEEEETHDCQVPSNWSNTFQIYFSKDQRY